MKKKVLKYFRPIFQGGKKEKRTKLLIMALVGMAVFVGLDADPSSAKANMSASLVGSVPPSMVQDFKAGVGLRSVNEVEAPVKKEIPKQKPKVNVAYTKVVGSTGYNSLVWQTDSNPFTTAMGTTTRWGVIASNDLAMGTKIRIPQYYGDQIFTVEDTGGFGYNKIDIWFPGLQDALNWGRRTITIEVLSS